MNFSDPSHQYGPESATQTASKAELRGIYAFSPRLQFLKILSRNRDTVTQFLAMHLIRSEDARKWGLIFEFIAYVLLPLAAFKKIHIVWYQSFSSPQGLIVTFIGGIVLLRTLEPFHQDPQIVKSLPLNPADVFRSIIRVQVVSFVIPMAISVFVTCLLGYFYGEFDIMNAKIPEGGGEIIPDTWPTPYQLWVGGLFIYYLCYASIYVGLRTAPRFNNIFSVLLRAVIFKAVMFVYMSLIILLVLIGLSQLLKENDMMEELIPLLLLPLIAFLSTLPLRLDKSAALRMVSRILKPQSL